MIKSAIFDVDGTILDSMKIWDDVGSIYIQSLGLVSENNLGDKLFSMSLNEGAEYLKTTYLLPYSADEIINGILRIIKNYYLYEVQTKTNVRCLLDFLKNNDIKMIVATSSDRNQIKSAFDRLGLSKYFDDIVTCEMVGKSKNYPDIYFKCTQILNSKPDETLVFEDALFAIKTAKNAEFKVVGVYDDSDKKDTNSIKSLANYYIQDFEKVADWGHHLLSL